MNIIGEIEHTIDELVFLYAYFKAWCVSNIDFIMSLLALIIIFKEVYRFSVKYVARGVRYALILIKKLFKILFAPVIAIRKEKEKALVKQMLKNNPPDVKEFNRKMEEYARQSKERREREKEIKERSEKAVSEMIARLNNGNDDDNDDYFPV